MKRVIAALIVALSCSACAGIKVEHAHLSHPFAGPPFGSQLEEDYVDTINVVGRVEIGRVYIEAGPGYKLNPGGGFFGPELTFSSRMGIDVWRKDR